MVDSERTGDNRVGIRAAQAALPVLQLFGNFHKMFDNGGVVVDNSTRVLNVIGHMSDDALRSYLVGIVDEKRTLEGG